MTKKNDGQAKPATAARIYDYYLGGTHNFPADREAAARMIAIFPQLPATTRVGRAFLRRSVRYIAERGVHQFLDLGSGIPTEGNVHEVVDAAVPDARVVYVDIDPVAVAESLAILEGSDRHLAMWGDLRNPRSILDSPEVRRILDFDQPIGLLLLGVLHFVPDDDVAYEAVSTLVSALAPGSYLAISHLTFDEQSFARSDVDSGKDVYRQQTTTPVGERTRAQFERFFDGLELVDPGVTWPPLWHPAPDDPTEFRDDPRGSAAYVGVGRVR